MIDDKTYRTVDEFYEFYLREHANPVSRRLHFIGTSIVVALGAAALLTGWWWLLAIAFVQAYALAWVGHFFFERNRPATLKFPLLSLLCDWRMWWDMLSGKLRF